MTAVDKSRAQAFANAALAGMADHGVPPTPENFEVWYCYATSECPDLTRAVDSIVAARGTFDESVMSSLHQRFIRRSKGDERILQIGQKFAVELGALLSTVQNAGADQSKYGNTLSHASGKLSQGNLSGTGLQAVIEEMIGETRIMEARSRVLEEQLHNSSREVSELRERLAEARRESLTDQLTGIPNRKAFETALTSGIQRAITMGEPICLVMCDIDRFKTFNDLWGHQMGDQVLRLVAQCLSDNVKGQDTAARYGGEEFALILPQTRLGDAVKLAEQIRTRVESRKLVKKSTGDVLGSVTLSAGVTLYDLGESSEDFVRRADECLYAAKRGGRNRVISEHDLPPKTDIAAA